MGDVRKLTWTADFKTTGAKGIEDMDKKFTGMKKNMGKLGKSMTKTGKSLTKKVTAPIVATGVAAMKTVTDFDDGMSKVRALTGASGEDFDKLRNKAIQLGNDTAFSALEASEGMQILAASGMETNDILAISGDMFTLMSAGSVDANTAASVLTNTMAQFNLETKESGRIIDVFAQGAASAKLGVDDLEYIMGQAGGTMASMNMDIEQSVAMAGQLANAGTPIGQVGTILNAMGREIKGNAKEFKKLGVDVYDPTTGKLKDMGTVMGELETKLKGKSDAERDAALSTVFSGQAMKGAIDWLSLGSEEYEKLTDEMYGAAGAGEKMKNEMEDNIGGAFRSLKSSIGTFLISIGDILKEPIKKIATFIQELTDKFNSLDTPTQKMIVKMGLIAATIGPVLLIGGKLLTGIAKLPEKLSLVSDGFNLIKGAISPTTLIIGGLIVAGIALYKNWDKVTETAGKLKEKWDSLVGAMKEKIVGWIEARKEGFNEKVQGAKNKWNDAKENISKTIKGKMQAASETFNSKVQGAKEKWNNAKTAINKKIKGVVTAATNKFHSAINAVREAWENLKEFLKDPITGTINLVKKGAGWVKDKVSGSHRIGKSRVPYNGYIAELHKDEIVLNAETAEKYRQLGGDKDRLPTENVTESTTKNVSLNNARNNSNFEFNPIINIKIEGNADESTVNDISRETQRVVKQELNKAFKKLMLQGV